MSGDVVFAHHWPLCGGSIFEFLRRVSGHSTCPEKVPIAVVKEWLYLVSLGQVRSLTNGCFGVAHTENKALRMAHRSSTSTR